MIILGNSSSGKLIAEISMLEASILEYQASDPVALVIRDKLFQQQPNYAWVVRPSSDPTGIISESYNIVCQTPDRRKYAYCTHSRELFDTYNERAWSLFASALVLSLVVRDSILSLQTATLNPTIISFGSIVDDQGLNIYLHEIINGLGQSVEIPQHLRQIPSESPEGRRVLR